MYFLIRYRTVFWWRRRELNPGPKILPLCLYMLSSRISSRIRFSPGTGIFGCQPEESYHPRSRHARLTSLLSRRPKSGLTGEGRWNGTAAYAASA
jgi:hypothetical protein